MWGLEAILLPGGVKGHSKCSRSIVHGRTPKSEGGHGPDAPQVFGLQEESQQFGDIGKRTTGLKNATVDVEMEAFML